MFISPVPRAPRPGLARRLCNARTLLMIGGVTVLLVWIAVAAIFIQNNKDTAYLNLTTNSKLKDRARFKHPPVAPIKGVEETTKQEKNEENAPPEPGKPDWWASDAHLDPKTRARREAVKQVRKIPALFRVSSRYLVEHFF